jgi:hypothetical protein
MDSIQVGRCVGTNYYSLYVRVCKYLLVSWYETSGRVDRPASMHGGGDNWNFKFPEIEMAHEQNGRLKVF